MRVTEEAKAATRKRILEVSRRLFGERGFETTTTRDIANAAEIASGTLFNYFATKEAIVESLVSEAYAAALERFSKSIEAGERRSLEEELFAHVAVTLRKLHPYRKYISAALETVLSPVAARRDDAPDSLRTAHLETVVRIVALHGCHRAVSGTALQIYWTLLTGVLGFWAKDASPRQEDTLALLDESIAMFVAWLTTQDASLSQESRS